jgi:hypothetical protein
MACLAHVVDNSGGVFHEIDAGRGGKTGYGFDSQHPRSIEASGTAFNRFRAAHRAATDGAGIRKMTGFWVIMAETAHRSPLTTVR